MAGKPNVSEDRLDFNAHLDQPVQVGWPAAPPGETAHTTRRDAEHGAEPKWREVRRTDVARVLVLLAIEKHLAPFAEFLTLLADYEFLIRDPGTDGYMVGTSMQMPHVFGTDRTVAGCLRSTVLSHIQVLSFMHEQGVTPPSRTPLSENKPRKYRTMSIRLTEDEYELVKERAAITHDSTSEFVREVVVNKSVPVVEIEPSAAQILERAKRLQDELAEGLPQDGRPRLEHDTNRPTLPIVVPRSTGSSTAGDLKVFVRQRLDSATGTAREHLGDATA